MMNFLILLGVHWFADFVLQTHWQASNKSKRLDALLRHVLVYTLVLSIGVDLLFPGIGWPTWARFVLANGVLHFITDFVTSRISSRLFMQQFESVSAPPPRYVQIVMKRDFNPHWFFVVVGLDQLIHQVTLGLTLKVFFG